MGPTFMICNILSDDNFRFAHTLGIYDQDTWAEVTSAEVLSLWNQVPSDPAQLYFAVHASEALAKSKNGAKAVKVLSDTARGTALVLRIASYVFEVLTGAFMAVNLFVIWWFCQERLFVLKDTLVTYRGFDEDEISSDSGSCDGDNS